MENKYTFSILFNNGKEETYTREITKEAAEEVATAFNESFREGQSAVVRLHSDDEFVFVRVSEVARVKVSQ